MAQRYGKNPRGIHKTLSRDIARAPSNQPLRSWSRTYQVRAPLERVFAAYIDSHPARVWPSRFVRFWAARLPGDDQHISASSPWPGICEGMKICVGLRLLTPSDLFNVWTGVQITSVQSLTSFRYEYLEGSTTIGANDVTFEAAGEQTRVHHRSLYCGSSRAEHAFLPLLEERYHGGFVDGMHAGLRHKIEDGGR